MNKNKALTALLAANRKALQGLHAIANMDFQQPYTLIEHHGKFTYNSIMKELLNVNTDYYNIFVLYKCAGYDNDRYKLARLDNGKFEAQSSTIYNYKAASGWRWFDTSIGNRTFENSRKSENGHYFIIAQEKQYENRSDNSYHAADRFKLHYRGSILEAATPYNRNSDKYYDNVIPHFSKATFDKSGYMQQINNYSQRVAKLKAERSEAAAALWDGTEIVRKFMDRIEVIHEQIINEFARTVINYRKIREAVWNIELCESSLKALKEKSFTSMNRINYAIADVDKYLTKAENAMKSVF